MQIRFLEMPLKHSMVKRLLYIKNSSMWLEELQAMITHVMYTGYIYLLESGKYITWIEEYRRIHRGVTDMN